jgi:preprotein translocase subunit YajC
MSGRTLAQLLPLLLIVAVFWLLIVRPARRRQSAMSQLQSTLHPGAEVMLNSGIIGRISSIDDEILRVEVAPQTVLRVHRQAVARVIDPESLIGDGGSDSTPGTDETPGTTVSS